EVGLEAGELEVLLELLLVLGEGGLLGELSVLGGEAALLELEALLFEEVALGSGGAHFGELRFLLLHGSSELEDAHCELLGEELSGLCHWRRGLGWGVFGSVLGLDEDSAPEVAVLDDVGELDEAASGVVAHAFEELIGEAALVFLE